jgi:hypothetical protein
MTFQKHSNPYNQQKYFARHVIEERMTKQLLFKHLLYLIRYIISHKEPPLHDFHSVTVQAETSA